MLDPGVWGACVDSALCIEEVCEGGCRGESGFEPSCFISAGDDWLKGFSTNGDGMLEVSSEVCFGDSRFGGNNKHRVVWGSVPVVISRRGVGVKVGGGNSRERGVVKRGWAGPWGVEAVGGCREVVGGGRRAGGGVGGAGGGERVKALTVACSSATAEAMLESRRARSFLRFSLD